MAAKRLLTPVVLILAVTLAVGIIQSTEESSHGGGHVTAAPAADHQAAAAPHADDAVVPTFFGECNPAEYGLRFMSEEWSESHMDKLASGEIPGCDRTVCYACHISAKPHDTGMQGNHITEYKQKRECYACHISPKNLKEGEKCPGQKPVKGKTCLKCHDYSYCNECHQAFKSHDKKFAVEMPVTEEEGTDEAAEPGHGEPAAEAGGVHADEAAPKTQTEYHKFAGHWDFLDDLTARSCSASGCHTQQFCNDCHIKLGKAPLDHESRDVVQMHPMFVAHGMTSSVAQRQDCSNCHSEMYCASCHLEGQDIHPFKWEGTGHAVRLNAISKGAEVTTEDRCVDCHKPQYCQKCHKAEGMMHSSHTDNWEKTHAQEPESKTYLCNTCHSPQFCSDCHEIRLPHTKEFNEDHKAEAMVVPDTCAACHDTTICMDCHKTKVPKDHQDTKDFYKKHKPLAEAVQPLPADKTGVINMELRKERLAKMAASGEEVASVKYCNLCHDDKKYCGMCHNVSTADVAHKDPEEWEKQHQNTTRITELQGCAHCHTLGYCYEECHKENVEKQMAKIEEQKSMAPDSIPESEMVREDHKLCLKCHMDDQWTYPGESACAECHEDITEENELAIHMKDCRSCHTPHTWEIQEKLVCATADCHKDIADKITVEKHKEKPNCANCHNSEKAHEWASAVKFAVCSTCHRKTGDEEGLLYDADDAPISKLHDVDAHERCGDCHDPHDASVDDPEACMDCHREDPLPSICTEDSAKTCSDPSCHPFRAEDQQSK